MKKMSHIFGLILLIGLLLYQPSVLAVKINLATQLDSTVRWTLYGACVSDSCSNMVDCRTQQVFDTGGAPANTICVGISLITPDGFARSNANVKFSGNCTSSGKSTQAPQVDNEGSMVAIFVSMPPITANSNIQVKLTQIPNPADPSGASDEFDVNCQLTPSP